MAFFRSASTGAYLIVANQDTDNPTVFRTHSQTGTLTPTVLTNKVPKPVCVKFWKAVE